MFLTCEIRSASKLMLPLCLLNIYLINQVIKSNIRPRLVATWLLAVWCHWLILQGKKITSKVHICIYTIHTFSLYVKRVVSRDNKISCGPPTQFLKCFSNTSEYLIVFPSS